MAAAGARAADEEIWAEHEQRAGALLASIPGPRPVSPGGWVFGGREVTRFRERVTETLTSLEPRVAGSVLMLLLRGRGRQIMWPMSGMLGNVGVLLRRRFEVTRPDALLAIRTVLDLPDYWDSFWAIRIAEAIVGRGGGSQPYQGAEADLLRALIASVDERECLRPADRAAMRGRLLGRLPEVRGGQVDASVVVPADAWAGVVLAQLATLTEEHGEVTALLRQLARPAAAKPTRSWLAVVGKLLEPEAARRAAEFMFIALVDVRPGDQVILSERNADLARGIVWAVAILPPSRQAVPGLVTVAGRWRGREEAAWSSGEKLANAAVWSLGQLGTADGIAALEQLAGRNRHSQLGKRISAWLAAAAEQAGLTPGQLAARSVPACGLDSQGAATFSAGAVTARVQVDDELTVCTNWAAVGWAPRPAPDAPAADVRVVKGELKELREVIATERRRLEDLLAAGRSWPLDEWRRYCLEHPIVGRLARRLIWRITTADAATRTGLPSADGRLHTISGDIPLPQDSTVTTWHPVTAPVAEVRAWRSWLFDRGLRQPFKQAFREIYLLTPAEEQTGTYSNRFASHILRYQQAYALFRERGWTASYLGPYDGGYDASARRDLPDAGLTCRFEHFQVDEGHLAGRAALCRTDRVWFHRSGDRAQVPVPIADVPPLAFSEAMRDVDLFVGVSSIALDPTWADRGADAHYGYWLQASSGALSASAEVRRDALARLIPRLKIADRVELGDRHVRVRGQLHEYKIHLGSANVMIEPDHRYLCIVPAPARSPRIMLPFDGDQVLSVILSKMTLLASDDKITDPEILAQLPR